MSEEIQRMLSATVLTLALHGALLFWRMQPPATVRPKPPARKITVSLKRLAPLPPIKKITHKAPPLPKIIPVNYQPIHPLMPEPKPLKKTVRKAPVPLKSKPVKRQPIRSSLPKLKPKSPKKTVRKAPAPPKSKPVKVKPLPAQPRNVIRTSMRSNPDPPPQPTQRVRSFTESRPAVSRQQPSRRISATSRTASHTPRRTMTKTALTTAPVRSGSGVVREAAPLYQRNPQPEYPRMARRRGLEGTVVLTVKVLENGSVAQVRLHHSSGYKLLDTSALKAVRRWHFSPGTKNGRPEVMEVLVPVRFKLN